MYAVIKIVNTLKKMHFSTLYIYILMGLLFLFPSEASAQTSVKSTSQKADTASYRLNIRGTVFENESLEPLQGASVKLYNAKDSLVGGQTTDKDGHYLLSNIPYAPYTLKISFMGFKEQSFSLKLPQKNGNFKVGDVLMRESATLMAEAVVEGQMPEMTVVDDTVMYNADAFKLPEGSLVEDLIKRLPGIVVDEDGKYTWNGKEISQILVDGKRFFGNNMNMILQNLPTEIIDKVKAYDRKSDQERITGIDDGEERTVLDLAIKKDKKKGWFGNGEGGYGTHDRYSGRFNMNRFIGEQKFAVVGNANNTQGNGMNDRQSGGVTMNLVKDKRWEINGNINGNFNQGGSERSSNSQSFENKKAAYSNSYNKSENRNKDFSFGLRTEWTPDSLTTIEIEPSFSFGNSSNSSQGKSASFNDDPYAQEGIIDPLKQIDLIKKKIGVNHRENASNGTDQNYSVSLSMSYNRRLNKPGRNISFGMSGGLNESESDGVNYSRTDYYQILAVTGEDSVYRKTQYNDRTNKGWNTGVRFSYSEPIADRVFLQFRYNYNYRFTDNDRSVSSIFDPFNERYGVNLTNYSDFRHYSVRDTAQCNYTTNTYQNHTVNLQLRINRTQYNLTVGGNLHPQRNEVDYTKGFKHYNVERSVLNASPNVNFTYKFSRQESLTFSYGGSMGQPGITDLIPDTLSNADPLNIRLGNPNLKPSFSQNINANYNKSIPDVQRSYSANIRFNTTQNSVSNRTEYNEITGGRITRPENINGNWNTNASFNFNSAISRDMRFHLNANTQGGLTNSVGYVYQSRTQETIKNRTRGARISQGLRISYRNDWLEVSGQGNINYNHSRSTNTSASNLDTYRFSYGVRTVMNFPWHMSFQTEINESSRRGYTEASMNTNELIWDFQISQRLLPKRNLTISMRAYDILNQRDEVNRNISSTARTDSRTANIRSYFLLSVNYRFGKFGGRGGNRRSEGMQGRGNENRGGGRGNDRTAQAGRPAAGGPGNNAPGNGGPRGGGRF